VNKALRTLYLYNGIFVLAGGLFGPLYAVYLQGIGATVQTITLSWSLFLISTTIFTFVVSRYGDTLKDKRLPLLAGFLIRAIVWLSYIFVDSVAMLCLLQIILGLGEALGSPVFNSLVAEHLDKGHHIRDYSDMNMIFTITSAAAAIMGGFIVVTLGFSYLFVSMSVLAMISFFGILLQPKRLL
jgi:MFS family permease